MKKIKLITLIFLFPFIMVYAINYFITSKAKGLTYEDAILIPKNKVGLILGTSKFLSNGQINLYYQYRVEAVALLFYNNKIDFVLVSGDNSKLNYDEPTDIKIDLMNLGIPENKIVLDYAGFRTLDSVIRAKQIFGLNRVTIISQKFHNERALYLAKCFGLEAIAFNAQDINGRFGIKTRYREYFARTKAVMDIFFNVEPKFLGTKIEIESIAS